MKILISSHLFYPSIGGIEKVGLLLAQQFSKKGHEVRVTTPTPGTAEHNFNFEIIRGPTPAGLFRLVRWCDVYFHNNISLQTAWPLLLVNRPWLIVHHTWIGRVDGSLGFRDRLKLFLLKFARNISVSGAVARSLPIPSKVIANPYAEDIFINTPQIPRDKELVFLGRLVSDKGVDLLIEALVLLKKEKLTPRLTVIGSGPELLSLQDLAKQLDVAAQINFVGAKTGLELVELLNQHQIMVVPSRWQEPFGLIALEGAACGCVIVGSAGGGLKEAIGPCGQTFSNGNVSELASILGDLINHPEKLKSYQKDAPLHLAAHQSDVVADAYLKQIEASVQK